MHSSPLLKKPKASVHYNLHSKPSVESNTSSHSIMFPTNHQRFENWFQVSHSSLDERLSLVLERMLGFFADIQACLFILLDSYNVLMSLNAICRCMRDWCIKSFLMIMCVSDVDDSSSTNFLGLVLQWLVENMIDQGDLSNWIQMLHPNVICLGYIVCDGDLTHTHNLIG